MAIQFHGHTQTLSSRSQAPALERGKRFASMKPYHTSGRRPYAAL